MPNPSPPHFKSKKSPAPGFKLAASCFPDRQSVNCATQPLLDAGQPWVVQRGSPREGIPISNLLRYTVTLLLCMKVNISQTLLQELLAYMFSVLLLITYTLVVQLNITLYEVPLIPQII